MSLCVIDAFGDKLIIGEDAITAYTRAAVVDMLRTAMNNVDAQRQRLSLAQAHGEADRFTGIELNKAASARESLDKLWKFVQNDNAESYYLCNSDKRTIDDPVYSEITAAQFLCKYLLRKGTLLEREYSVELVPNIGAAVAVKIDKTEAYLSIYRTDDITYTLEDKREYALVKRKVQHINETARIFKCKQCGKAAYIPRADDARKLAQGLQPVQRCWSCIQTRRRAREQK